MDRLSRVNGHFRYKSVIGKANWNSVLLAASLWNSRHLFESMGDSGKVPFGRYNVLTDKESVMNLSGCSTAELTKEKNASIAVLQVSEQQATRGIQMAITNTPA